MFNPIKWFLNKKRKEKERRKLAYWCYHFLAMNCKDIPYLSTMSYLFFGCDEDPYDRQHHEFVKNIVQLIEDGADETKVIEYLQSTVDEVFGYEPEDEDSVEKAVKGIFEKHREIVAA